MADPTATDEYRRRGIEVVFLENEHLRVEVLVGKGGDVTKIRDKRTDVNILFESPHEWRAPGNGYIGAPDRTFSFMDHYPGGWQDVFPAPGSPSTVHGAPFGAHGESTLLPWNAQIEHSDAEAAVVLSVELTRYPLSAERRLSLSAGESTLRVSETVTNRGELSLEYAWLQHLVFGSPLVGPDAKVDIDAARVHADPDPGPNARLPAGETFTWPALETVADLSAIPNKRERVHEQATLSDLSGGRYSVLNSEIDLGVTVEFTKSVYRYVWYWGAFGGYERAPYFGRNYNLGLEPCTSMTAGGLAEAVENSTANQIDPGETITAEMSVEAHTVV